MSPNSQTVGPSVPSDLVARLRMWAIRLHKETFGSTISDGPQTGPKVEETDYWKAADRIEELERQLEAKSDGPAEGAVLEAVEPALRYIQHIGANHVMRGEPHPQQWIVDRLESLIRALKNAR